MPRSSFDRKQLSRSKIANLTGVRWFDDASGWTLCGAVDDGWLGADGRWTSTNSWLDALKSMRGAGSGDEPGGIATARWAIVPSVVTP